MFLLLSGAGVSGQVAQQAHWPAPREVGEDLLGRHGLRRIEGRHVTLVTDLPASNQVDALPGVVDAAVPLWEARFGVGAPDDWRVLACLIKDREKFLAAGLMPVGNEQFPYGLSIGYELWVNDQSTDYYRRHLLLHEATHSFMATQLGGCGPGWFMEGMAELLGQHQWQPATGELELGVMLPEGNDARSLGRVGLLQKAFLNKRALSIASVMQIDNNRVLQNESYAWVWALAKFLDTHPRYQQRFRDLEQRVLEPDFNEKMRQAYAEDLSNLTTEWSIFIATLQYGHDIAAEAIDFKKGTPLASAATSTTTLSAARGWQPSRVLVERGKSYRIQTAGMYTIAVEGAHKIESTAAGVTLDYHAGNPLGVLLGAIDPRDAAGQKVSAGARGGFLRPAKLRAAARFTAPYSGTLYLRVNDSPAKLGDNSGELSVVVRQQP